MKKRGYFYILVLAFGIAIIAKQGYSASRVAVGKVGADSLDSVSRTIQDHFTQYKWTILKFQEKDGSNSITMSAHDSGGVLIYPAEDGHYQIRVVSFDSYFSPGANDDVLKEILSLFKESSADYASDTYYKLNPGVRLKTCFIDSLD